MAWQPGGWGSTLCFCHADFTEFSASSSTSATQFLPLILRERAGKCVERHVGVGVGVGAVAGSGSGSGVGYHLL